MVEGGPIKEVKLAPIRNGTVIDHITCGQALNVMKILGVNENNIDSSISIGMHVISAKTTEWKDIIKIEDRELDSKTVDKPRRSTRSPSSPPTPPSRSSATSTWPRSTRSAWTTMSSDSPGAATPTASPTAGSP